jgi:hypothetical protein
MQWSVSLAVLASTLALARGWPKLWRGWSGELSLARRKAPPAPYPSRSLVHGEI